jgi:penicillin G amidase
MRLVKYLGAALALLVVAALLSVYLTLRASLPRLQGEQHQPGLSAAVRITRDARGVPTIEATNRDDLAYASGFLHAQDRFFQMDLSRRLAAGELSELVGAAALEQDRKARLFRFRMVAGQVVAQLSPEQRALVEAYTRGVNAGLKDLAGRPWEYWVLGQPPAPWRAEDSLLVAYAMWWDLQANGLRREILRQEINAHLKGPECGAGWKCALQFFYPAGTSWDAPDAVDPAPLATAPIPDASVLDVRDSTPRALTAAANVFSPAPGSNNWAVAGSLTTNGAALLANDMHLGQRVPTVWYRARLKVAASATTAALDLNGVMLPGTPLMVAGSNGEVAWGFTNSYGTWLDVAAVPCTAIGEHELTSPAGSVPLEVAREQIRVKGAAAVTLEVRTAAAGVLLRVDPAARLCWFGSWLAQQPAATNMNLVGMERVHSVAEALRLAPEIGSPHQNALLADRGGHIAWTIFGRIPEDTSRARAHRGAPWTTPADHPYIMDPPLARLWSANARVASDPRQLELIGGSVAAFGAEYDLGARASQIRGDLLRLHGAVTPADMLRIQLDDRADFLARWRTLLLGVLDAAGVQGHPERATVRQLVADWNAAATTDSVGYRIVRAYRERTAQAVWEGLLAALDIPADDDAFAPAQFEGPLWQILNARPTHLLAKQYGSWPQFLGAQADGTIADLARDCPELNRCTWGARNEVHVRHPLSRSLPGLSWLLDMPTLELPGDHDMPRVQDGSFGASERFAVSPGHEDEGYLTLPGGQSGHPLSPYYRAGFAQWARGETLPFLPGPAQHTLTLLP